MVEKLTKKVRRVLVVDDHASGQELMSFVLRGLGYEYEAAWNGLEGVKKSISRRF